MIEPSHPAPAPGTRRTCPDCGAEFDAPARRGAADICCDACQMKRLALVHTVSRAKVPPKLETRWWRSRTMLLWLLIAGTIASAGFVWRKTVSQHYHRWSQGVHARRAVEYFEKKDYDHAILEGRSALEMDPFDVETNRIIAKCFEARGPFEAIPWRARLNFIRPGDPENAIAWAQDALSTGSLDVADDALAVLKPADRASAAFHDISAKLAMARTDSVKAESHWTDAVRLAPGSEDYRLQLATLQVRSRSATVRATAAKALESLGENPRHRLIALRALIEDAMNHEEFPRARELADRLVASSDATFTEKLGRLAVLRTQEAADAPEYLEQLRDESLQNPEQFALLLHWMNQNGLPVLVSDWVPRLPPALVSQPPVCLVVADSYGRDRDWPKLRAFVEKASWKDFDHVRLAHLAHALENFGNVVAAESTWGRAIVECREKPERLAMLARLAQAWRWETRAELTLRKLSADDRTPLWVLDALWAIAKKSGDAGEMHRLSRLIVKSRPKNPAARNNFIRLSLLRHTDEGEPDQLAATLFKERPTDITCAITYGLSLFLQDRVFDALQILRAFPAAELREPEVALYYGIFLQASGDSEKAAEFLKLARGAPMLREEEELITRAKRESRSNTLTPTPKSTPLPPK